MKKLVFLWIILLILSGCGHEHMPGDWVTVIPASCTAEGTRQKVCTDCGEVLETGTVAAAGHTGAWAVIGEADCLREGTRVSICKTCGAELEREAIAPLGHDLRQQVTAPTKTQRGYTRTTCSRCHLETLGDYVDALGSEGLAWESNGDGKTCTVTGIGSCTDSWVVIPSRIQGYAVTAIGRLAFRGVTGITELTVPSSVEYVGQQAFDQCADLHTVYYNSTYSNRENRFLVSSNVTKVVFGGERVPERILEQATRITEVVIGDGVTAIEGYAFSGCSNLVTVELGKDVTDIGSSAFAGCWNLTGITLPEGLTGIGYRAFYECRSLTELVIPDSVTGLGEYAFFDCSRLKQISVPAGLDLSASGIEYVRTGLKEGLQIIRR